MIYEQILLMTWLFCQIDKNFLEDLKNSINPNLALINIDRFRDINNSYGIKIGDKILKAFAKRLVMFKKQKFKCL